MKKPGNRKLIIVDDNLALLQSLELALGEEYQVFTFLNGDECLAELDAIQPQVILTDYEMHGMNGLELTKAIKQRCPEVAVILITSVLSQDLIETARRAGVQLCISKPFDLDELKWLLRKVAED